MLGSPKKRCPWNYSARQKVWNYIRRNPIFRVGDIMITLEVKQGFLKQMFWYLSEAGYIRIDDDKVEYTDRVYTLMKNTGIKVPSMVGDKLYDYNTGEEIVVERKKVSFADIKTSVIEILADGEKSTAEILAQTKGHRASLSRVIKELLEDGTIISTKWGHYSIKKDTE